MTDGEVVLKISNGVPLMQKITGAGCALTAVIAAFITVDSSSIIEATAFALAVYGYLSPTTFILKFLCRVISEIAFECAKIKGPGSLRTGMLDWFHCVTKEDFISKVKIVKE